MRKPVFLFSILFISLSSDAQKMINISDSTMLKQYFGKSVEVTTVSADRKVTTAMQTAIQLPVSQENAQERNIGIPGGPVIRMTRNTEAATLRKEMAAISRNMDWSPILTTLTRLQFHVFVNPEGSVDSLIYYLVRTDTTRRTLDFRMRDRLDRLEEGSLRTHLESEWMKIIKNFKDQAAASPVRTYSGSVILRRPPQNLDEFLNTQPENITEINLTDFGLTEFPPQLKRFRNLKNINLKDNYITSATINTKDFPKLATLSLQNNMLSDGSFRITGRKGPSAVNLTDNHFTHIPKTHRKVRYLFLANSSVTEISRKDIRKVKKVQSLNLYGNVITEISPRIGRLKKLKELDLYRNRLTALPSRITRMKRLETLAVSYNQLEELPAGIGSMSRLKVLYSHHNRLKSLPPLPPRLEILDVGFNRLKEVSWRIQPLKDLKSLDYSYNQVSGDLDFLLGLPQIKEIYLMENRYAGTEEEEKYFSRVFSTLVTKGVTVK